MILSLIYLVNLPQHIASAYRIANTEIERDVGTLNGKQPLSELIDEMMSVNGGVYKEEIEAHITKVREIIESGNTFVKVYTGEECGYNNNYSSANYVCNSYTE